MVSVLGKRYLASQAATLLQFATTTTNAQLSAVLVEKAAQIKARIDAEHHSDMSVTPPDVQRNETP